MWQGLLGKKIGMTQFFEEDGTRIGVTVVEAGPCPILQLKTKESDGYDAFQIGFDPKPEHLVALRKDGKKRKNLVVNKAEIGHAAKTENLPHRFVREIRLREPNADLEAGKVLSLEDWGDIAKVQVSAKSKGKGFQGGIKRHNFGGMSATHGVKITHRHLGSTGSLTPTRVMPGQKMPGHMGDEWVTQKGLKVAKVIPEKNLILIRGSVPGPNGGYVIIRPAQPFMPPVE
jgi:large subunit ribosomal protein L3